MCEPTGQVNTDIYTYIHTDSKSRYLVVKSFNHDNRSSLDRPAQADCAITELHPPCSAAIRSFVSSGFGQTLDGTSLMRLPTPASWEFDSWKPSSRILCLQPMQLSVPRHRPGKRPRSWSWQTSISQKCRRDCSCARALSAVVETRHGPCAVNIHNPEKVA